MSRYQYFRSPSLLKIFHRLSGRNPASTVNSSNFQIEEFSETHGSCVQDNAAAYRKDCRRSLYERRWEEKSGLLQMVEKVR